MLVVLTKGEPALSEMEGTQPEEARPSRFLYTSFVRVSVQIFFARRLRPVRFACRRRTPQPLTVIAMVFQEFVIVAGDLPFNVKLITGLPGRHCQLLPFGLDTGEIGACVGLRRRVRSRDADSR